ncbi:unnamed protein product, partial [Sphacelaria rigidula]
LCTLLDHPGTALYYSLYCCTVKSRNQRACAPVPWNVELYTLCISLAKLAEVGKHRFLHTIFFKGPISKPRSQANLKSGLGSSLWGDAKCPRRVLSVFLT